MRQLHKRLVRAAAAGLVGLGVAFTALGVTATAPRAASLTEVGGRLTGATGVDLGTLGFFDVLFVGGSCITSFSGCNNATEDFTFTDSTDAGIASQALLDQVFLDVGTGPTSAGFFDKNPSLTTSCISNFSCEALVPYALAAVAGAPVVETRVALNAQNEALDIIGFQTRPITLNFSLAGSLVWAMFTPAPVVIPIPAALPLFGTGLGILGFLGWRRRRKAIEAV